MRKDAAVFVDVERHQSADGRDAIKRVEEEPLMLQRAPPGFDYRVRECQFRQGQDPAQPLVVTRSLTWALTFSTPAYANTTGVVSEGVAP